MSDIYISNEVVAPSKLARVADLAHQLAAGKGQLAIAVDSPEGVRRLADAMNRRRQGGPAAIIDVFVEIDVGQGRCGVAPGRLAVDLVIEIRRHPALRFAGLQAYHGRAQHLRSPQARRDAIAQVVQDVQFTKKSLEKEGFPVGLVTGAGTGSMVCEAASGVFGELQAGSFLFMDADYAANERDPAQPQFENALFVKSQVMSSGLLHAVCDAGHKSHAVDSGLPKVLALEPTGELEYVNASDEHGVLKPAGGNQRVPRLDDTIWLIPGHCDPTVNLHNFLVGVTGGLERGRVDKIIRVDARGALS